MFFLKRRKFIIVTFSFPNFASSHFSFKSLTFQFLKTHFLFSGQVHNSLTCFDKMHTAVAHRGPWLYKSLQVNKDHLHFLWAFSSSFPPMWTRPTRKGKTEISRPGYQILESPHFHQIIWWPLSFFLPCLRKNGLFSSVHITGEREKGVLSLSKWS